MKHFLQLCCGGPTRPLVLPRLLHRKHDVGRVGWGTKRRRRALAAFNMVKKVFEAPPRLIYVQDFPANDAKPVHERECQRRLLFTEHTTRTVAEADGIHRNGQLNDAI